MATAAPLRAVPDLEPDLRLAPRPLRPGSVRRPRLVRELSRAPGPLAVLVAPAGYGKTTLLQQWAESDPRPFVWLSSGTRPEHLLGALADRMDDPMVVVVDDAQRLQGPEALRALAEHAAPGSLLVLASRCELPLPLGRMRADGAVTELGASDLAMTAVEAATFLRRTGLRLAEAETDLIVRRTEGWPAGLRLAELSLREQDDLGAAVERFGGDDRFVADFIRDEVLADLAEEDVAFLTGVAPLEPLTGPLCDAALGRRGSAGVLRDLAHGSVPLTALDRSDERFRVHPLLGEMLRAELRRDEPERAAEIHRRASAWHEGQDDLRRATDHAMAAGDVDRVSDHLWRVAPAYAADGRAAELARWLDELHDTDIAARPALALTAALRSLAAGDRDGAERWADAAERRITAPDRSLAAGLALVRAWVARDGAERMGEDATRAYTRAEPDSPLRASACLLVGAAHQITGAHERARAALEEGARRSGPGASAVRSLCLAQLAVLALHAGERDDAMRLADRARASLVHLDDRGAAPVLATAALTYAVGGRIADARRDAESARRLLGEPAAEAPWAAAQVRLVLASAELRLSDAATARELLTEASRLARSVPDALALQGDVADAWERADTFAAGAVAGPTSLTTAELRVLRFLPSHLSFREIAARLHVSANTVKSQAHAVYRKLDASSRSEAVARARAVGLVDG